MLKMNSGNGKGIFKAKRHGQEHLSDLHVKQKQQKATWFKNSFTCCKQD